MPGIQSGTASLTVDPSAASLESPTEERPKVTIHQGDALQHEDAHLGILWDSLMGDVGNRSVYRTVSALLISWDDKSGDLKTEEEVFISMDHQNGTHF